MSSLVGEGKRAVVIMWLQRFCGREYVPYSLEPEAPSLTWMALGLAVDGPRCSEEHFDRPNR